MAHDFLLSKFEHYERSGTWNSVFHRIIIESQKQERALKLSSKVAHFIQNVEKNRYRDVSPWDTNRITLVNVADDETGYINASPVFVPNTERRYILTQGPLEDTCADFWLMCWENNCKGIIMLNRTIEKGQVKCEEYYPDVDSDAFVEFGCFRITCLEQLDLPNYTIKKLELNNLDKGESRIVQHFHYRQWPDFGCPQSTDDFLEFLDECRNAGILTSSRDDPAPIVHCSAGIGRTGAFIICDAILHMVESKIETNVDPEALIVELRKSRMGLIQTAQQLRFCWMSIVDRLAKLSTNETPQENSEVPSETEGNTNSVQEASSEPSAPSESLSSITSTKHSHSTNLPDDDEFETKLAKRRVFLAQMVAKQRAAMVAASNGSSSSSGKLFGFSLSALAAAGAVAVFAVAYFAYTKSH